MRSAGAQEKVTVHQRVKSSGADAAYRSVPVHFEHWIYLQRVTNIFLASDLRSNHFFYFISCAPFSGSSIHWTSNSIYCIADIGEWSSFILTFHINLCGLYWNICSFIPRIQSQRVPTVKNGFKQGMKLEGIDPQHPSMYFVLTVAEVSQTSINSVDGS